ncbi:MAG: sulfatase, partial [Verrucomicrobiales bacterium]|nr:sulfatase [Verrucomicrobiales bacterium]
RVAGASTAKSKPLDGTDIWPSIAEGKPSNRKEMLYNVDPFGGALRQGDWKLVWKSVLPSSLELFDLKKDPNETTNLAAQQPEKVRDLQARLETLAKDSEKPLFMKTAMDAVFSGIFGPAPIPTEAGEATSEP